MASEQEILEQMAALEHSPYQTQPKGDQDAAFKAALYKLGGGALGAGVGALLAAPTGGMSIPMGVALGSTLGGAAGSLAGAPGQLEEAKRNTKYAKDLQGEQRGRNRELSALQNKLAALRARRLMLQRMQQQNQNMANTFLA